MHHFLGYFCHDVFFTFEGVRVNSSFSGWHFLVALVIIVWLAFRSRRYKAAGSNQQQTKGASQRVITGAHEWPALGQYGFEVVGESHYQPALRKLVGKHGDDSPRLHVRATLVPDDKNPYDKQAVRVDVDGKPVGHMSRDDARLFRRRLDGAGLKGMPTRCHAMVMGGFVRDGGERASYGVMLDIEPFQ